jgi:hypothetical protein
MDKLYGSNSRASSPVFLSLDARVVAQQMIRCPQIVIMVTKVSDLSLTMRLNHFIVILQRLFGMIMDLIQKRYDGRF